MPDFLTKQPDESWKNRNRSVSPSPSVLEMTPADYSSTLILNEEWDTLDTNKWYREASTYGSDGNRIQRYRHENVVVSAATTGGNGNSLKLIAKREFYIDSDFTAGMLGTRDLSVWYPRYGRYSFRQKIPHGQGIWPAAWLRHRNGSSECEPDVMEYTNAQRPGQVSWALHRRPSIGQSTQVNTFLKFEPFEAPNVSYQQTGNNWWVSSMDILPWTASTVAGGTFGDPNATSSQYVLFRCWLNDTLVHQYVDTSAAYWTGLRQGDQTFDICLQGAQIGGIYQGHPDDPLGYSRWLNGGSCLIGGTAPNDCNTSYAGFTNIAPVFPATYEIDWVRVWRFEEPI